MNISSEEQIDNDVYRWYADTIVYRGFGPVIACLGFVGGTLSCLVFRRKSLRNKSCSVYFLFLALADLLCMICWLVHFVLPTYNIHVLTQSNFLCKLFVFAMYFAFDLANYILTACSIDRAMSVLFPLKCRWFCRPKVAYTVTVVLVIIHTFLNTHLFYGFVVKSVNSTQSQSILICHHRDDSEAYRRFFSAYDSYVDVIKANIIPFVIMSICNTIIILRVCRTNSSLYDRKKRSTSGKSKRKHEKDRQLTLMLLGSAIAFLVLTLPTEINDIIRSHSNQTVVNEKIYLLSAILLALAHLNYAVHFYIYTLTGEVFRQQLLKLWPINVLWPYLIAFFRCKQTSLTTNSTTDTNNNRKRQILNSENTLLDTSLTIRANPDDDSLIL